MPTTKSVEYPCSKIIEQYTQQSLSPPKNTPSDTTLQALNTVSLTSGAPWVHTRAGEDVGNVAMEDVHRVSRANRDLLAIGHDFWLAKITAFDPQNREAVNQALTTCLKTLNEVIQNGIAQESQASVKPSLSHLEENLHNTPLLVKKALYNQIQEKEAAIHPNGDQVLEIKKAQLLQQNVLLTNYISPNNSADSTATQQPTPEDITKTQATLTNLFNRKKCLDLVEKTIPDMQENGTINFVDLLGYCLDSLEETEGKYHDPEKIDTLMGVLSECALSYEDSASCADGIIERCQRDGYMIRESQTKNENESQSDGASLLTQIREHYAENKLMATSDEPSSLLGLLIMDTLLRKSGHLTWSVQDDTQKRKILQQQPQNNVNAYQAHLERKIEDLSTTLTQQKQALTLTKIDLYVSKIMVAKHTKTESTVKIFTDKLLEITKDNPDATTQVTRKNDPKTSQATLPEDNVTATLLQKKQKLLQELTSPATRKTVDKKLESDNEKSPLLPTQITSHKHEENQHHASHLTIAHHTPHTTKLAELISQGDHKSFDTEASAPSTVTAEEFACLNESLKENTKEIATHQAQIKKTEAAQQNYTQKLETLQDIRKPTQAHLNQLLSEPVVAKSPPKSIEELDNVLSQIQVQHSTFDSPDSDSSKHHKLAQECQNLSIMVERINNPQNWDPTIVLPHVLKRFYAKHETMIMQMVETLEHYGFTREHSLTLLRTACLTENFNETATCPIPPLVQRWCQAYQEALHYLDVNNTQYSIPRFLRKEKENAKSSFVQVLQDEWLNPLQEKLDKLLQQGATNIGKAVEHNNMRLVLPAVCKNTEQAENIVAFITNDAFSEHFEEYKTTFWSAIRGNDSVHLHMLSQTLKQENPDWDQVDKLVTEIFAYGRNSACIDCLQSIVRAKELEHLPKSLIEKLVKEVLNRQQPWSIQAMPIVQKLLDFCNENQMNSVVTSHKPQGVSALNHAIHHQQTNLAELLIDHFIATHDYAESYALLFDDRTPEGDTPLHNAILLNETQIAHKLINHALSSLDTQALTIPDYSGNTPLHYACMTPAPSIATVLVSALAKHAPEKLFQQNRLKQSPLYDAIRHNNPSLLNAMLHATTSYPDAVQALSTKDIREDTFLHAAFNHLTDDESIMTIINFLDTHHPDVFSQPAYQDIVHTAIKCDRQAAAEKLFQILSIRNPTGLIEQDEKGNTALHTALKTDNTRLAAQMIPILQQHTPAFATITNHKQQTPLDLLPQPHHGNENEINELVQALSPGQKSPSWPSGKMR